MRPYFIARADLDPGVIKQAKEDEEQPDYEEPRKLPHFQPQEARGGRKGQEDRYSPHERDRFGMDLAVSGVVEDLEPVRQVFRQWRQDQCQDKR